MAGGIPDLKGSLRVSPAPGEWGTSPADLVQVRVWAEAGCVVSFQHHLLHSRRFLGGRGGTGGLWKVISALSALGRDGQSGGACVYQGRTWTGGLGGPGGADSLRGRSSVKWGGFFFFLLFFL